MQKLKLLKPFLLGAVASGIVAQSPGQLDTDSETEEVFELSPFEVSAGSDAGYRATETIAGTRFNSKLKDVPSQIDIMTKEFLEDIAAVDVNDAFQYSANVENDTEYSNAQQGFESGVVNIAASGRIRGLSTPGKSRDFFTTLIPRDGYNIDRITISSGPNAILFGNANPGGVVNTAFIRARADSVRRKVEVRFDSFGSMRGSFDVNLPIIQDRLAVRVAGVHSDQKYWVSPASKEDSRISLAGLFKATDGTTFRAYYEEVGWESVKARPTRTGDSVTPWIDAGRPLFDNSNPDSVVNSDFFEKYGDASHPIYITNTNGDVPTQTWGTGSQSTDVRSVATLGPGDFADGIDSHVYSLPADESLFPYDVNIQGDSTRNNLGGEVYGVAFEQKLPGGGYLEVGYNREKMDYQSSDLLRNWTLFADANLYLPDENLYTSNPTPNPNVGRYYVETQNNAQIQGYRGELEEMRAQISYDFDFTNRDGPLQWIGRHRVAGMISRSEQMASQQYFNQKLLPSDWTEEQLRQNFATGGNDGITGGEDDIVRSRLNTIIRSYIDDPNDPNGWAYSFSAPYNPLEVTTFQWTDDLTYWGGVNNPWGSDLGQTLQNDRIDSKVIAIQSNLLKDRLILSYGRRQDDPSKDSYSLQRIDGPDSGFESIYEAELPTDFEDQEGGKTETAGAVLHIFPWMSAYYNESSTWNTEYQHINPIDGTNYPGNIGDGKDYGISMRLFDGKLSFRINKYQNVTGPDWNVPYRNAVIDPVWKIERIIDTAYDAGKIDTPIPRPTYFDWDTRPIYQKYNLLTDKDASGYEFNLTANLTDSWTMTLNGSKGETVSSNIGREWIQLIEERAPIYAENADLWYANDKNNPLSKRYLGLLQTLNTIKQADGQSVDGARSARANLITRYNFRDGRFKGIFTGGAVRWRDNNVLGYQSVLTENEFPFEGAPDEFLVPAIDSPIFGPESLDIDFFLGFKKKIGGDINWRCQLNVRNLFDKTDPLAQRVNQEDAYVTVYRIPEPRSFILTNTFEF